MSQNKHNQPQNQQTPQLSNAIIEQMLKTQHLNALNESEEIKLRSKEIELQSKFAEKSLEIQARIISNNPAENRKTMTRYAYIVGGFSLIFLIFAGFCLYIKKEDFILKLLSGVSYVVTTVLGYYFGTKNNSANNNKSTNPSSIPDAQVVE